MLALTFLDKSDYDKIKEDDSLVILGLNEFSTGVNLKIQINHIDKTSDIIEVCHTYNKNQIDWFYAGSSLNLISKS